jgi:ferredoxin--NADP+ reductase
VPNVEGRVLRDGAVSPREYVVGWAKRGPSGLIGTNRGDSHGVVAKMNEDRAAKPALGVAPEAVLELLRSRNVRATTFADWKKLDAHEQNEGKARGKVRAKVTSVAEMLRVIG